MTAARPAIVRSPSIQPLMSTSRAGYSATTWTLGGVPVTANAGLLMKKAAASAGIPYAIGFAGLTRIFRMLPGT